MKDAHHSKLYLPALSIIAVVIILLAITGISTYRNLDRTENRVSVDVQRQAAMLLRALEAGARAGMVMPMLDVDELGRLFRETARDNDITAIYLVDDDGIIIHHSNPALENTRANWPSKKIEPTLMPFETFRHSDGQLVFYMAKRFSPTAAPSSMGHIHMGRMHRLANATLVVGLSMESYEQARSADIHHALFMGTIMVSLGAGALFFLFVIQNYYLVGRALRQNRDDTRQVIRNLADGLVSIDRQGRLLFLNPPAARFLGLEGSGEAGAGISRRISFETVGIRAALDSGETTLNREVLMETEPGKVMPLSFNVTPLCNDDGTVRGAVALIRDLTEIKALETKMRRAETLSAIGELAASVAHEIRNPLSSIKTGVQFLIRKMVPEKPESEYGRLIVSEVDRINRVVTDLLAFSRPTDPVREPEDLVSLCRHSLQLVHAEAEAKGISVSLQSTDDTLIVDVDRHQLIQVLLNLLLNALAAVEAGGRIEMRAAMNTAARCAEIAVIDSGPGITTQAREKLFEPFFTTREQGTGLGLAIAKKLVEGHGGQIRVDSPVPPSDHGSAFTVCFPVTTKRLVPGDTP